MSGSDWNDNIAGADSTDAYHNEPAPDPNASAQAAEPTPQAAQAESGAPQHGQSADTLQFGVGDTSGTPPARRRKRLFIAAGAGVVVGAAAVGIALGTTGGGPHLTANQTPAQAIAAATHNANSVSSLAATFTERIGGPSGGSVSATVTEQHKPLKMAMTLTETLGGQTIPLSGIITSNTIYIKFGHLAGLPAALAGKWLKISVSSLPGSFGTFFQGMENENPVAQAQTLLAAKGLRADGTQTIAGVQTTKYTGYFNPAQTLHLLPASERSALGPSLSRLQGNVQFSIWIDGSDQIRRLVENEVVESTPVTVDMTFTSFNKPVNIALPPANKVVPYPASGLGG